MSSPLDKQRKITDKRISHCVVCGNDYHPSKSAPSVYCSLCEAVMASLRKQDADLQRSRAQLDAEYEALIEPNEKLKELLTEPKCCGKPGTVVPGSTQACGKCNPPSSPREGFAPPHEGTPPVKPLFKGNSAPVGLIPSVMLFEMGRAMKDGAEKHGGAFNWRSGETQSLMYHCNAAIGHILQFVDGENVASDSGISHLAHAAAQLAIALDKVKYRTDTDDRVGGSNE